MTAEHKAWHEALVRSLMRRYGVSEEYADAQAIIQKNYYPASVDLVGLSHGSVGYTLY